MNIGKKYYGFISKVTVSSPFRVDLDVGIYVLPALLRNNYRYVLEAILRKNGKEEKDRRDASLDKTLQQPLV